MKNERVVLYDSRDVIVLVKAALKKLDLDAKETSVSELISELGGEDE